MAENVGHELLALWKNLFLENTGDKYTGSLYRDSAQLKNIAKDIGRGEVVEAMRYYFENTSRPTFDYFIFNYDRVVEQKNRYEEDQYRREIVRKKTRSRIKEMGIPVGHDGTLLPTNKEDDD
jgi:hypothetical protein